MSLFIDQESARACVDLVEAARQRLLKTTPVKDGRFSGLRIVDDEKRKEYTLGRGTIRQGRHAQLTPEALEYVRAYLQDGKNRQTYFAELAGISRSTLVRHAGIIRRAQRKATS